MQSPDNLKGQSFPEAMGHRDSASTEGTQGRSSQKPLVDNKVHIADEEIQSM